MTFRFYTNLLLILILLFACKHTYAQNVVTWKKRIARTIELDQRVNINPGDSNLYKYFLANILSHKVKAYSALEPFPQKEFDPVMDDFANRSGDTEITIDPNTGSEKTIVTSKPNYDTLKSYHILEDWEYDPVSGNTTVEIVAIGPVKRIYDFDGAYRGTVTMFWLRYHDALTVIRAYEQKTGVPVMQNIWHEYFHSNVMHSYAVPTIDVDGTNIIKTPRYAEYNEGLEEPIAEMINMQVHMGRLNAYKTTDSGLCRPLLHNEIDSILKPIHIPEEHAGDCYLPAMTYYVQFGAITNYLLLEDWKANQQTGKTEMKVLAVAPVENDARSDRKDKPLFWVRYSDIQDIIMRYDQYYPENTFALNIWNDFFYSNKLQ